jgi:hypothetical protein
MFRAIKKFCLLYRLRVSQDNIEYYHYWLKRLERTNGTADLVEPSAPKSSSHGLS